MRFMSSYQVFQLIKSSRRQKRKSTRLTKPTTEIYWVIFWKFEITLNFLLTLGCICWTPSCICCVTAKLGCNGNPCGIVQGIACCSCWTCWAPCCVDIDTTGIMGRSLVMICCCWRLGIADIAVKHKFKGKLYILHGYVSGKHEHYEHYCILTHYWFRLNVLRLLRLLLLLKLQLMYGLLLLL